MLHLARCSFLRFQLASRHLRRHEETCWASCLNHPSFERKLLVLPGLLHVEGYHIDRLCEFAREHRLNLFMQAAQTARLEPGSPRDLLVAFDFGYFQPKPQQELQTLWLGAVKRDPSRLRPLYRYVCNIKMKLEALSTDLRSYQAVEDQTHSIGRPAEAEPQPPTISVRHCSPLFIDDEARVSSGLQMDIFRRDKQLVALLEKLRV